MDTWTADIWNGDEAKCKRILNEPGNWEKVMEIDWLSICKICIPEFINENEVHAFFFISICKSFHHH